jgi:hypothetical protein
VSTSLNLTMRRPTLDDLHERAGRLNGFSSLASRAVVAACVAAESTGHGEWRVRLSPAALSWVEREAPDIAAGWPQVFTGPEVLVGEPTLAELVGRVHRHGSDGCDLEADVDANGEVVRVRVRFVGSSALVITTERFGMRLRWEAGPAKATDVALALVQREAAREDARGEADR